tara:strand:+ start:163 stop:1056 length:894 start_codon:yes stop_codon:yes gene_type:complete
MSFHDLPTALTGLITAEVVANTTDWDAHDRIRDAVHDAMRTEPCACGGMKPDGWPGQVGQAQLPSTKWYTNCCQTSDCRRRNFAEFEARVGAPYHEPDKAALDRRLGYAFSWDSVCHASRLEDACWEALLREKFSYRGTPFSPVRAGYQGPLAALAVARPVLGLSARQLLARLRTPRTDQQLVDIHRALLLDDVDAFLAAVREQPGLLLLEVSSQASGKHIGLVESRRDELQVDPRVARFISWFADERWRRFRCGPPSLRRVTEEVNPQRIMQLIGFELDGDNDSDDTAYLKELRRG